jgi:hypothetical protein
MFSGRLIPFLLFILAALPFTPLFSQMPDWTFFKDREGNEYYYDGAFKIRITDEPDFNYPPVSGRGIEYYYNSGLEHLGRGEVVKGLYFFKSILALKEQNNRLRQIQINSADQISSLEKRHGTRMALFDRESTLLILKEGASFRLINEKLFYALTLPARPWIIRKGWKYSEKGYGLQFGINLDTSGKSGYDFITGVETRILPFAVDTADQAERIWVRDLGPDAFSRELIRNSAHSKVYAFTYPGDSPFRGYEGIFVNRDTIHLVRIMYHENMRSLVEQSVLDLMKGFILVK